MAQSISGLEPNDRLSARSLRVEGGWRRIGALAALGGAGVVLSIPLLNGVRQGRIGEELQTIVLLASGVALVVLAFRSTLLRVPVVFSIAGISLLYAALATQASRSQLGVPAVLVCGSLVAVAGYSLALQLHCQLTGVATLLGGLFVGTTMSVGRYGYALGLLWGTGLALYAFLSAHRFRWCGLVFASIVSTMIWLTLASSHANTVATKLFFILTVTVAMVFFHVFPSMQEMQTIWQVFIVEVTTLAAPWSAYVMVNVLQPATRTHTAMLIFAIAGLSTTVALASRRWTTDEHWVSLLVGACVTLAIGATYALSGMHLVVTLTVLSLTMSIAALSIRNSIRVRFVALSLQLVAFVAIAARLAEAAQNAVAMRDGVLSGVALAVLGLGFYLQRDAAFQIRGVFGVYTALSMGWIAVTLHPLSFGAVISAVLWLGLAAGFAVTGVRSDKTLLAGIGVTVLWATIVKVILIDLADQSPTVRLACAALALLGALALSYQAARHIRSTPQDTATA